MHYIALAICLLASFTSGAHFASYDNVIEPKRCETISVPMCKDIEYNQTSMPNQFNHNSQDEAAMEAHQFWALVEINCAPELRFFLCSLYTPICLPTYSQPIKACRSVCSRARLGCESYMKKFGFEWPEHMNCDLFPEYGSTKEVCMDPMDANQKMSKATLQINTDIITSSGIGGGGQEKQNTLLVNKLNRNVTKQVQAKVCPSPFLTVTNNDLRFNRLSTANIQNCIQPCHGIYFTQLQREFTSYWLLFWSLLCFLSSLCTTCTYLIDPSRFKYPEKPIIFLSICYLFVSLGQLMRHTVGHSQMACENAAIRYDLNTISTTTNTNQHFNSPIACTLSFIFTYYFGMASSVWWVIVALTWFLAAGLKWGTEAIAKYSTCFHLIAWLLPFIQTCLVLFLSLVDADALSGTCYVGNLSVDNLRMFVILPALIYLIIGVTFLFAGFVSLFRIRQLIQQQHSGDSTKTHRLEKLMLRIGVFSILYTVPATCVIACQMYEQVYRADWEMNAICKRIHLTGNVALMQSQCSSYDVYASGLDKEPEFSVFVLKYFMMLIIGVTSGFWIWTSKTLNTWEVFLTRVFCCFVKSQQVNGDKRTGGRKKFWKIFRTASASSHKTRKNSVIYFQANDDLENNPHNNFYESSSTGGENMPLQHEIMTKNATSPSSGIGSSYKNPESIVSLQFNSTNHTIGTSLPYYSTDGGVPMTMVHNPQMLMDRYGEFKNFRQQDSKQYSPYSSSRK